LNKEVSIIWRDLKEVISKPLKIYNMLELWFILEEEEMIFQIDLKD